MKSNNDRSKTIIRKTTKNYHTPADKLTALPEYILIASDGQVVNGIIG